VLGPAASLLLACGQDRSNLIPPANAQALNARLEQVKAALDAGDCTNISQLVAAAKREAANLPATVDRRLRQRINDGIRALESEAPTQCTTPATQTETIPTVTTPAETTHTSTTTQTTATTQTTPTTPTTATPTTTTPTSTETTPAPGTGGIAPSEGTTTP
jgi:hypothetical protein